MDVLDMVYDALIDDNFIKLQAQGRIKFYEYPESGDVSAPYIIIYPLDVPLPSEFADDNWLANDFLLQIDVWTKKRSSTREIAEHIQKIMWNLGFSQVGGIDEYDNGIYRDARRYRGKLYRDDFDSL